MYNYVVFPTRPRRGFCATYVFTLEEAKIEKSKCESLFGFKWTIKKVSKPCKF